MYEKTTPRVLLGLLLRIRKFEDPPFIWDHPVYSAGESIAEEKVGQSESSQE